MEIWSSESQTLARLFSNFPNSSIIKFIPCVSLQVRTNLHALKKVYSWSRVTKVMPSICIGPWTSVLENEQNSITRGQPSCSSSLLNASGEESGDPTHIHVEMAADLALTWKPQTWQLTSHLPDYSCTLCLCEATRYTSSNDGRRKVSVV